VPLSQQLGVMILDGAKNLPVGVHRFCLNNPDFGDKPVYMFRLSLVLAVCPEKRKKKALRWSAGVSGDEEEEI
jgi:hypothetical protein